MPATPSCDELLARLDRWLARHRPRYRKGLRPAASAVDLDGLQADLGRPPPAELRDLLAWHDGQGDDFNWRSNPEEKPVAPSLTAWLEDFVAAVEHGEYHQDPERGSFLRRAK